MMSVFLIIACICLFVLIVLFVFSLFFLPHCLSVCPVWWFVYSHLCIYCLLFYIYKGSSWSLSYGSQIKNYICNQWLSPQTFDFESCSRRCVLDTILCDKVFTEYSVFILPIKLTPHDIDDIFLIIALNTITIHHPKYFGWHMCSMISHPE
jgi:hypothetical protein